MNNTHRIYSVSVASVYPHYVAKAEKKGRTKAEVDQIIRWLTGHSQETLEQELGKRTSFEDFFAQAPQMNPSRSLITGVVCGPVGRPGYLALRRRGAFRLRPSRIGGLAEGSGFLSGVWDSLSVPERWTGARHVERAGVCRP